MKIELEIDGQMIEGEFTLSDGAARLSFGGATREAQVSEPEPGMFTVIINDRVYRCALEESPGGAVEVIVNGERIPVAARDKKHLRGQTAPRRQADRSNSWRRCPAKSYACCSTPETKWPRAKECWSSKR